MIEIDSRSLASGIAGTVLVLLLTLPSLIAGLSHLRKSKAEPEIYEDKDGVATEESMAKYSATLPRVFLAIFVFFGLLTSVALAILGTLAFDPRSSMFLEDWLNAAQWVCARDYTTNLNLLTLRSSYFFFRLLVC